MHVPGIFPPTVTASTRRDSSHAFLPCASSGDRQTRGHYPFAIDTSVRTRSPSNPYATPPQSAQDQRRQSCFSTYSSGEACLPTESLDSSYSADLYHVSVNMSHFGDDHHNPASTVQQFRVYDSAEGFEGHSPVFGIKHESTPSAMFNPVSFEDALPSPAYMDHLHGTAYADFSGMLGQYSSFGLENHDQKWQMAATLTHPRPMETLALANPLFSTSESISPTSSTMTSFDPSASLLTPSFSSCGSSTVAFNDSFEYDSSRIHAPASIVPSQTFADDSIMHTSSPGSYAGDDGYTSHADGYVSTCKKEESPDSKSVRATVLPNRKRTIPSSVGIGNRAGRSNARRTETGSGQRRRRCKQELPEVSERFDRHGNEIEYSEDFDEGRCTRGAYGKPVMRQTNSKNKPHKCEVCKSGFDRREHLMRHIESHTGVRKYFCPFFGHSKCEKVGGIGVGRPDNCRDHIATHIKNHLKLGRVEKDRGRNGAVSMERAEKLIRAAYDSEDRARRELDLIQRNVRKLASVLTFHESELTFPMFREPIKAKL